MHYKQAVPTNKESHDTALTVVAPEQAAVRTPVEVLVGVVGVHRLVLGAIEYRVPNGQHGTDGGHLLSHLHHPSPHPGCPEAL